MTAGEQQEGLLDWSRRQENCAASPSLYIKDLLAYTGTINEKTIPSTLSNSNQDHRNQTSIHAIISIKKIPIPHLQFQDIKMLGQAPTIFHANSLFPMHFSWMNHFVGLHTPIYGAVPHPTPSSLALPQ